MNMFIYLLYLWIIRIESRKQPNIIVFLADDLGFGDHSINNRSNDIQTPILQNLSDTGLHMNHLYTEPVCSPSRTAFQTGRYAHELGLQMNQDPQTSAVIQTNPRIPLDVPTIGEYLQRRGYQTHYIGKWHLGYQDIKFTPTYRGYHSFYGSRGSINGDTGVITATNYGYDLWKNTTLDWETIHNRENNLDTYTNHIVDLIQKHPTSDNKPFFITFSYSQPHFPLLPYSPGMDQCLHIVNLLRRNLCSMVVGIDQSVGRVLDTIKSQGLYDDTLVFFFSDNGGEIGRQNDELPDRLLHSASSNAPLLGEKGTLFEGGVRTNLLIGGGYNKNNQLYTLPIRLVDITATILDVTGRSKRRKVNGRSFQYLFRRRQTGSSKPHISESFPISLVLAPTQDDRVSGSIIFNDRFKLIVDGGGLLLHKRDNLFYRGRYVRGVDGNLVENTTYILDESNVYLFDILEDPTETLNLVNKSTYQDVLQTGMEEFHRLAADIRPSQVNKIDPGSLPILHNGTIDIFTPQEIPVFPPPLFNCTLCEQFASVCFSDRGCQCLKSLNQTHISWGGFYSLCTQNVPLACRFCFPYSICPVPNIYF